MGTYGISVSVLVDKICHALDIVEGDFDKKTLRKALDKCKKYPYVMDGTEKEQVEWHKYFIKINK